MGRLSTSISKPVLPPSMLERYVQLSRMARTGNPCLGQKLILLWFMRAPQKLSHALPGQPVAFDKLALKFEDWDEARFRDAGFRVVPGAIVRPRRLHRPARVLMRASSISARIVGSGTMGRYLGDDRLLRTGWRAMPYFRRCRHRRRAGAYR